MVGVEVVLGTCSGLWGEERVANDNGGKSGKNAKVRSGGNFKFYHP